MIRIEDREKIAAKFFSLAMDHLCVAGFDGYFKYLNPVWAETFGFTFEEFTAVPFVSFIHPNDVQSTIDAANSVSEGATLIKFRNRYRCKNGDYRALDWTAVRDLEQELIYAIGRDVTDLVANSDRNKILTSTVEAAVDAMLAIDGRGTLLSANAAVETLFGYCPDEIIGRNVNILMPNPYHDAHDDYLSRYQRTNEARIIGIGREVVGKRKDGTVFPIDLTVCEVLLDGEKIYTGIIRDITERKNVERIKAEFISTVSHELRTPLTSIVGSLGLVNAGVLGELPEQYREMLGIAHSNSQRLVALINDILDIEKLESNTLEIGIGPIDLRAVAEKAVALNQVYAAQNGTRLQLSCPLTHALVLGNEERLMQVMTNLLSNAAKYSPNGTDVEISIEAVGGSIVFSVRDFGSGVPAEFHDRMFQRFSQADSSATRKLGGTGLGLNICRAIIERLGGTIAHDATVEPGARFYFTLPRLRKTVATAEHEEIAYFTERILVCEDDADGGRVLKALFVAGGYDVDIALSVTEARALLATNDYDAMTLDLNLQGEDGLDLLAKIRSDPATRTLPVVVISGMERSQGSEALASSLGIVDWLTKPYDQHRLSAIVRQITTGDRAKPMVLHVEDDTSNHRIVSALLAEETELDHATSLKEARQFLSTKRYDLVLIDMGLPDGQGDSLIGELAGTPVVIFSAQEVGAEISSRVHAALVKSRDSVERLVSVVRQLIHGRPEDNG